ncbi:TlpA disulfide reductase family protein [Metabacillus fastidiosus]|uniref:peroxiredoxin family protein n=1 Tax=Metabacillus fastidiosus TaxID=1458 RepID=UPI002E1CE334|nr:TlpA disulfide reductase family protein [Metabacillus fastidiosus]
MNKNLLSIAIIAVAVAIVFVNLWKPAPTEGEKKKETAVEEETKDSDLSEVQEGKPAPDFELATLDDDRVKLSDYKGKKLILNFWATWCPPCNAEMPHMQNFYEKNKDNGIEVLAVNLMSMDNGLPVIKDFAEDYGLSFTIPLDQKGDIGIQYQAFTIPTSYIIDSNGVITKKIVGPMDEDMMMNLTKDIN